MCHKLKIIILALVKSQLSIVICVGHSQRMRDAHKLEGNNKNHSRTGKYYLWGKTERAVTGYSKVKTAGCVLHNIPQIQQKNAMKREWIVCVLQCSMRDVNEWSWALKQIKGSVEPLPSRFTGEVRLISVKRDICGNWMHRQKHLKVLLIK